LEALSKWPGSVSLLVGEERTLQLPSLAGAGYRWEVSVVDGESAGVKTRFDEAAASPPAEAAFSPFELLVIRGRRVGRTRVRCSQRRSWESETPAVDERVLTIDVVAAAPDPSSEEASKT
jgi:predicted secreted protein